MRRHSRRSSGWKGGTLARPVIDPLTDTNYLAGEGAERARIALAQATTSLATLGLRPRPAWRSDLTSAATGLVQVTRSFNSESPSGRRCGPCGTSLSTGRPPASRAEREPEPVAAAEA